MTRRKSTLNEAEELAITELLEAAQNLFDASNVVEVTIERTRAGKAQMMFGGRWLSLNEEEEGV